MISIKVTLIRLKLSQEPVAIFELQNNMASLGRMVDEVTDPASCQYSDVTLEIDFEVIFPDPSPEFLENEEAKFDAIDLGRFSVIPCDQILSAFVKKTTKWVDFPEDFDFMSSGLDFEDRIVCQIPKQDIF